MICKSKKPPLSGRLFTFHEAPGSDLLSHGLSHTTIGAGAFHFRVRDGNGWDHAAVSAREAVEVAATLVCEVQRTRIGTWDVSFALSSHTRMCVEATGLREF